MYFNLKLKKEKTNLTLFSNKLTLAASSGVRVWSVLLWSLLPPEKHSQSRMPCRHHKSVMPKGASQHVFPHLLSVLGLFLTSKAYFWSIYKGNADVCAKG